MNSNLNRGVWKSMENKWADALSSKPPKKVKIEIKSIYEENSKRPDAFEVKYIIGDEKRTRTFLNMPRG